MPRQARLDAFGALHHIMIRGINKSAIFLDDEDRQSFLERLALNIGGTGCSIYAWTLMDNHAHLLFQSGTRGISAVMRRQLTWYAMYFNRKYGRTGHLFENRYKSVLCEADRYLLALIRYIHLNPIRVGIITTLAALDKYPWTGHSTIMGNSHNGWMNANYVLNWFGTGVPRARAAYREFVNEGLSQGRVPELTGGKPRQNPGSRGKIPRADDRILGTEKFAARVHAVVADNETLRLKNKVPAKNIRDIITAQCAAMHISRTALMSRSRKRTVSRARAVIAGKCVDEYGMTLAATARCLGINTSSVKKALNRL